MKTYWVALGDHTIPILRSVDCRFFVPLRPVIEACGATWGGAYRKLFQRMDKLDITTHLVQQGDEIVPMSTIPLVQLGWVLRSIPNIGQAKIPAAVALDHKAVLILKALDIFTSALLSGHGDGNPSVEAGLLAQIGELEAKAAAGCKAVKQRNRLPRVAITARERMTWAAKARAGKSYAAIADEAGRHPATVRRAILQEEGC